MTPTESIVLKLILSRRLSEHFGSRLAMSFTDVCFYSGFFRQIDHFKWPVLGMVTQGLYSTLNPAVLTEVSKRLILRFLQFRQ